MIKLIKDYFLRRRNEKIKDSVAYSCLSKNEIKVIRFKTKEWMLYFGLGKDAIGLAQDNLIIRDISYCIISSVVKTSCEHKPYKNRVENKNE